MSKPTSDVIPFLELKAQHADLKTQLMTALEEALAGAAFIGGPAVSEFEAAFAAFVETAQAVGVGSGTDALRLALLALGLKPGQRVVTVPNTFIATTEAISQAGGVIDFVDVDPATSLLDPNRLEDLLRARFDNGPPALRPAAVVPVHLYGQCVDMGAVNALAARYELLVLEDAAQAHGARCQGRAAGSLGHAAAFSFYPGKNLGACGEAGAVTTSDAEVAAKVAMLRDHGQSQKYHHQAEGYNARLDAIQARFLSAKLPHLPAWNEARRSVAQRYDQALAALDWVRPVTVAPGNLPARHLYVVHAPDRDGLQKHLADQGIQSGLHYPLPLHLQPCYAHLGLGPGAFPVAEDLAARLLSLPLFPEMTPAQVDRVVTAVAAFGKGA